MKKAISLVVTAVFFSCSNGPATGENSELHDTVLKGETISQHDPTVDRNLSTDGSNSDITISSQESAIKINGVTLLPKQINELVDIYGIAPQSGNYWYDVRSGLYGVLGYQAYGFMMPGHNFEPMQSNVSSGSSGIYVNGRQLPESEWLIWSKLLGYVIMPGAYWLDENGNAGYEGDPTPTDNLYLAAQRNSYATGGGGGDNFWSTRFSAGNSNASNSQGYVSVPGYGPVGYGF